MSYVCMVLCFCCQSVTLTVRYVTCRRYDHTFVIEVFVYMYEVELLFKQLIARIGVKIHANGINREVF
jgi:hypothetical protein